MHISKNLTLAAVAALMLGGPALAQQDVEIPAQTVNEELRARVPAEILESGKIVSVNNGSFPPYDIIIDADNISGASIDMGEAIGQLLGLEVEHTTVSGLPAVLAGIGSGRFQFAMGPIGDFKSRQEANDFVDWVQEFVVFAVQAANPKGIEELASTCGLRISVMAGGSAERVVTEQGEKCKAEGKEAVEVQAYTDQPTALLAVRSNRADAFFSSQAPLTYFAQQSNGELELAGVGKKNGFNDLLQGAVVAKDSALGPILVDAFKILHENGTYDAVMTKWGLDNNKLDTPGINLSQY